MPTQIVHLDLESAPESLRVRDDVGALLVVTRVGGRAVKLCRVPRPASGIFETRATIESSRGEIEVMQAAMTAHAAPAVSVIVCTHERPDDLERCLESLRLALRDGDETIVVDNDPRTNRTIDVAARFNVRYTKEISRGLNRARNAGLRTSANDVIAFVDDDVVVAPHWRDAIAACFCDPAIECATGLVLPIELETAAQEEFEIYSEHRRTFITRVYSGRDLRASAADVVGIGANMAYRRRLLLELGGFDVRLDAGTCTRSGGDTDMFARVLEAGRQIAYSPGAQVWHRHRRTLPEVTACAFGYGAGTFGMLTKRVVERGDLGALVTAARWIAGTALKAVREKVARRPSPRWTVIVAEWAGAACGPFFFAYEAWKNRSSAAG